MRQAKKTGKQLLSLLLTLVMLLGFVPMSMSMSPVIASASNQVPDAPTRELASVIKFVDAKTNYLGGIALDAAGKVWSWGYNTHGMLGLGLATSEYAGGMTRIPYFVDNDINIVQIEGGYHTNYALDDNGILYAWGKGNEGQMGNNTVTVTNPVPTVVTSLSGIAITKVFTSTEASNATYALADDGRVFAWGYSAGGRIPTASAAYQRTAIHQPGFDGIDIVDISLGFTHGLLLDSSGQVYAWGTNAYGQLGQGNTTTYANPVLLQYFVGMTVTGISAQYNSSMAMTADGKAYKWGTVYEATPASRESSYDGSAGGPLTYSITGRSRSANLPELVEFDLRSASDLYSTAPPVASVTAGRYVNYVTDIYGRVWYFGWNVNFGFGTDGPLFTTTNGGKHSVYKTDATLLRTLGDGDTQGYMNNVIAPVFSGATSTTDFLAQYNSYARFGQWSQMGDGLHPTIYDKKYMVTTDSGHPTSHTNDYPVDALGRRLVYVVSRDNGIYSGNFYVAEDSYTGPWSHNLSSANLPAGITEETSVPLVKEEERPWIGLVVDLDSFDYTGGQLNELPYMVNISAASSSVLFIDNSGNLYKQSMDGSGSNAWGWDYSKYEVGTAGNSATRGLYNFYNYELSFMRGAPLVSGMEISFSSTGETIYLIDDGYGNTPTDTVSVSISVPGSVTSNQLNLTVVPELTNLRYVFIPFDLDDPNFNKAMIDANVFDAAYFSGVYQTGDLLSSGQSYVDGTYTFDVEIAGNGKLWVMGSDIAYNRTQNYTGIYNADNFIIPEGIEPLVVTDYKKSAAPDVFMDNGDIINYAISFTMPEDLEGYEAAKIVDVLPSIGLAYNNMATYIVDDTARLVPVTIVDNKVTFELEDDEFTGVAGKLITLVLEFTVQGWVEGSIENEAELYFKPIDRNYPLAPDASDNEVIEAAIVTEIGPPTNVMDYPGDRKIALLWSDPEVGEVAYYQIKIDDFDWVDYQLTELGIDPTYQPAIRWYVLFEYLPDGTRLVNFTEYTFEIRAVSTDGIIGSSFTILSTPAEIMTEIGPPTDVTDLPGIRKIALLWSDPEDGEVAYYQIKVNLTDYDVFDWIDEFDWIDYQLVDLTLDPYFGTSRWFFLIEELADGTRLLDFTEYTIELRAVSTEGLVGESVTLFSMTGGGDPPDSTNTDLLDIYGFNVVPEGGWPSYKSDEGTTTAAPLTTTVQLPANFLYTIVHRNFVVVGQDATFKMYSDPDFTNEVVIVERLDSDFNWLDDVHIYLHVTSGNRMYEKYYDVTVTRAVIAASIFGFNAGTLSNSASSPLEVAPLSRSSSTLEVGNLIGSSNGGLQLMPLGGNPPPNPADFDGYTVLVLVYGETEYTIDMRHDLARIGPRGTRMFLNFYTDPSFNDQYLVARAHSLIGGQLDILWESSDPSVYPVQVGANDTVFLYLEYVEDYPFNPTKEYYLVEIQGPPVGLTVYMESLAGESTHPPQGGQGTIPDDINQSAPFDPFTSTIYLPYDKDTIINPDLYNNQDYDIVLTGGGMQLLYGDDSYTGNGKDPVTLSLGENHLYTQVISNVSGNLVAFYYDITAYRGFPFLKSADRLFYEPGEHGEILSYSIDLTLLRPFDPQTETVSIIDDYDEINVEFIEVESIVATLSTGVFTLDENDDYTITDINGVLTITLTDTGLGKMEAGAELQVIVNFEIKDTATGTISNTAELLLNSVPFGRSTENVFPNDFDKTATPGYFVKDEDEIIYTLSFTMPDDLSKLESVRIVDRIPNGISYQGMAQLTTSSGTNNRPMTTLGDTIYLDIAGQEFQGLAGEKISLALWFEIDGWQSGSITNTAELYFTPAGGTLPQVPDTTADETIYPLNTDDVEKTASLGTYVPGGIIEYTIDWTLPSDVGGIDGLTLVDNYDADLVEINESSSTIIVSVGTDVLIYGTDYQVKNSTNLGIGTLEIEFEDDGIDKLVDSETITVYTKFDVLDIQGPATEDIENNVALFYNGVKVDEADETVVPSNFTKTADDSRYVAGEDLGYTITVELPQGISNRKYIEIVDEYPTAMLTFASVESLTIGISSLTSTQYSITQGVSNTPGRSTITVRIDRDVPGHFPFGGYDGVDLVLKLNFTVAPNTTGEIRNDADIYYDADIGGRFYHIIDIDDFEKNATLGVYVPGEKINYILSWTLPDDLSATPINELYIIDNFNTSLVSFDAITDVTVYTGGVPIILDPNVDYSFGIDPATGTLTINFSQAGIAWFSNSSVVEIRYAMDVEDDATGIIRNDAELYINGDKVGEDFEEVTKSDFEKTVHENRYVAGEELNYEFTMTLPTGIENRKVLEIVDTYPSGMLTNPTVTSYSIGSDDLMIPAGQFEIDTSVAGELKITIDINDGHYDFSTKAGETLLLEVSFTVADNTTGEIRNDATIAFDSEIGGRGTIIIDVDNFSKDATLSRYTPGGTIEYTISWNLPTNVSSITSLSVVDNYDITKVSFDELNIGLRDLVKISIDGTALDYTTDFTASNTASTGTLTISLTTSGIAKLVDDGLIEVTILFDVLSSATGPIQNKSQLFYNNRQDPDGEDTETVYPNDLDKEVQESRYVPGDTLTYKVTVTLPDGIENRTYIDIVDYYPAELINPEFISLTIGGNQLVAGQYGIDNRAGEYAVWIDYVNESGHYDFTGDAGEILELIVQFEVAASAAGAILNEVEIMYDHFLGGKKEEIIDENNFSKDAALSTYTPGGTIDYTVSWTLPTDINTISGIRVVDNYDISKVYPSANTDSISINSVALVRGTDYTVTDGPAASQMTYTFTSTGLAKLSTGADVELNVEFTVRDTATGDIENNAQLFYNQNTTPDAEDNEIVTLSDFQKTVAQSRYLPGETLDYTISVTLPNGIANRRYIEITDYFPANQLTNGTVVSLTVATGTSLVSLTPSQYSTSITANGNAGELKVTIDRQAAGHYDFNSDAGKVLTLNLTFQVASTVTGTIMNDAEIRYDNTVGGRGRQTITPNDFNKTASQTAYSPGGKVDYTVSWTLPDDVSNIFMLRILDNYDVTKVTFGQVMSLTVGTQTLVLNDDYTIDNAGGVLRVELTTMGITKLSNSAKVEIKVEFNVLPTASGDIDNNAQMYYNQNTTPDGEDNETIPQGGYNPASVVLQARKVVTGAGAPALSAGQFEFILRNSSDVEIGRVTNNANGEIIFATITSLTAPGTYTYTIREVIGSAANWTLDTTIYTVEVVVTPSGADLIAIVNYPGAAGTTANPPPTFTNTYRAPGNPGPGPGGRPDTPLPDVPVPTAFIEDHVAFLIGYPDGTVRPSRNVTRAEVATVFFRLLSDTTRNGNWTTVNYYTDVRSNAWYNNGISVMSGMRILNGYPDGTFKPDGSITRGELATVAARFARAQFRPPTEGLSFSDISGHWAENDIRYAAALGWVNGYPDGTFRPNQPITRAEYVTLVNRMLERVPETLDDLLPDEMITWVDNANNSAWYYIAIQEASNSHEAEYKTDKIVPGLEFEYEFWTELIENRDWSLLEKEWSESNAGELPPRERPGLDE